MKPESARSIQFANIYFCNVFGLINKRWSFIFEYSWSHCEALEVDYRNIVCLRHYLMDLSSVFSVGLFCLSMKAKFYSSELAS